MSIFCTGILLSKSGLASNILALLFSLSCSISEEFSLKGRFLPASFPLLCVHPFCHNRFSNLHSSFLFPNSSGCTHRGSRTGAALTRLQSACFPRTRFRKGSNFTSRVSTSHFFAALWSLSANSLFELSIFTKCHMSLSLGDKEASIHGVTKSGQDWVTELNWTEQLWFSLSLQLFYPCSTIVCEV